MLFRTRSWVTAAVSEAGGSHIEAGVPCQDSCRVLVGSDVLIACTADGAGSSRYSDEGSQAAVDAFVEVSAALLRRGHDPKKIVCDAFREARRAVSETGGSERRDKAEFATTLLGVVATRRRVAAAQIGDGAVILDGKVALKSHNGRYANETSFITQDGIEPYFYASQRRVKRVALITDGLEHLVLQFKGQRRLAYQPFFDPMFQWLKEADQDERIEQLPEFLRSDMIRARTGDDVTLVLAMR